MSAGIFCGQAALAMPVLQSEDQTSKAIRQPLFRVPLPL
jgi:hypothetical protein